MELYFVQHGAAKTEAEHPRSELDRGGTRNRKSASQIRLRMFASSQCAPYRAGCSRRSCGAPARLRADGFSSPPVLELSQCERLDQNCNSRITVARVSLEKQSFSMILVA